MHADLNDWGPRLSSLGGFDPPASGWQGVIAAREGRESRRDARWPVAVAAAVIALTAGLAFWLQSAQRALSADAGAGMPPDALLAADMRAESDRLEAFLAALPEPRAMRGSTAYTVSELEDRIAYLDDRLSRVAVEPNAPERAEALWRERVGVLSTLVQVRYADAIGTY
jgi:hypothetical protein